MRYSRLCSEQIEQTDDTKMPHIRPPIGPKTEQANVGAKCFT